MADRIESWYFETPPITRTYATASFIISLLCQLRMLSPFHLHFSWELIFYGRQYWRLITNFFFFGTFGLDFLFHMFYLTRYCRMLEEGSFRGRPADFLYMLFLGAVSITLMAPFLPRYSLPFLGSPLTFMMVYIWARRNPFIHLNYLGLFVFQAPYLPWVLLSFSLLLSHGWPTGDLVGIVVGHVYWFLEDVYPRMLDSQGNRRGKVLKTPWFFQRIFQTRDHEDISIPSEPAVEPEPSGADSTSPTPPSSTNASNTTDTSSTHVSAGEDSRRNEANSEPADERRGANEGQRLGTM